MSEKIECPICYEAVIDFPEANATGSHRTSCGHIFHPKCITKWYIQQETSTCPMCRNLANDTENTVEEPEVGPYSLLYVTLPQLTPLVGYHPNPTTTSMGNSVETLNLGTTLAGLVALLEELPSPLSETQPLLADTTLVAHRYNNHPCPPSFNVVEPPEVPRFMLHREDIHRLLQEHGSNATMEEFFNEEEGDEQIIIVTMTLQSLNARFVSLGATPIDTEANVWLETP